MIPWRLSVSVRADWDSFLPSPDARPPAIEFRFERTGNQTVIQSTVVLCNIMITSAGLLSISRISRRFLTTRPTDERNTCWLNIGVAI
jgi:hypothetical protein